MSRYYDEPVEVRTTATPEGPQPEQFRWHRRLYVVHEVLDSWVESGSWWTAPSARRLVAGSDEPAGRTGTGGAGSVLLQARPEEQPVEAGPPGGSGVPEEGEREIWRVRASAGRGRGYGVFELGHGDGGWRLVRVHD